MASINKEEAKSSNSGSLLPRLFALKCISGKYMRCESEGGVGLLTFSVEGILYEPRTRFEVEPTSIPGVVHIRCTFNNKYLRRDSESSEWIRALATKKSEDRQGWDCTMFEILPSKQGGGRIHLRHVQLGYYLAPYTEFGLKAASATPSGVYFHFTFIDWSSLVVLPRYVAFKGPDGKYLNANQFGGSIISSFQFRSDDKGEEGVTMEVIPSTDGNFKIRQGPGQSNLHWEIIRFFTPLYWSDYQAVKDETNRVSFKHLLNNKFCRIKDLPNYPNSYVADSSSITQDTKLIVEEAVMRRNLEIQWRLEDARVYNVMPCELNGSTHDNNSSSPVTKLVTLTYETAVTTSFEVSNTWSKGLKGTIKSPSFPYIGGNMEIEMSKMNGGSCTVAKSTTVTRTFSETDTYTIPPRTRLVVQKLSTNGYCDVPYNYVQTSIYSTAMSLEPIKRMASLKASTTSTSTHPIEMSLSRNHG